MLKRLAFIVAMLFIPALAKADTVSTYQGNAVGNLLANPEGNTANGFAIEGTVTFAGPLAPNQPDPVLSFSFT